MKTFNFYLDQKVTTWMRTDFEIEATTLEEAKRKAIAFHNEENKTAEISWNEIDDTKETIDVSENGGCSTEEIFTSDGVNIWNNGITDIN